MEQVDEGPAVGRWTRGGVYTFLLVFAIAGIAHLELFPFSGFRLFSAVRPADHHSWQLRAVEADGDETPIDLADLPRGVRHTSARLGDFRHLTPAERDEVCDGWARSVRAGGAEVVTVRVYQVVTPVNPDGPPPRRTLSYECGTAP